MSTRQTFARETEERCGGYIFRAYNFPAEIHIKRQATRHDCLPSLLGEWGQMNRNSVWRGKKYFVLG
jgi:hypothetical protein